jgi:outer membrane receptor for ferrienterochelin and colicins
LRAGSPRRCCKLWVCAGWALVALLGVAWPAVAGQVAPPPTVSGDGRYTAPLTLEQLMNDFQLEQEVTISTKTEQRAAETPAVVTVVTGAEIQTRGYHNLAEVLRAVPGFYDVYDMVSHNVGVRGINGGPRASGSVIKLMIDGHPTDYRPTTGNHFGEELIPLPLIERVEIIRGPASALYGANAFLGVVNVVTKRGQDLAGARLVMVGTMRGRQPGGGLGVILGHEAGPVDVAVGAELQQIDRSGLSLPKESPDPGDAAAQGPSRGDMARPMTAFGRLRIHGVLGGMVELMGSIQRLDAGGEFQDFSALTHGTRLSTMNQNYRLRYEYTSTGGTRVRLSVHGFQAGPTSDERLDIGRPELVLIRNVGARGVGTAAETQLTGSHLTVTAGVDAVLEQHRLQTFSELYRQPVFNADGSVRIKIGTVVPLGAPSAELSLRNLGAFGQALLSLSDSWKLTGGGRLDVHSVYQPQPSIRAGLVYAPSTSHVSLKLLYGSSFKAPSVEQLHTQPMKTLDIQGNVNLAPQTAHTLELYSGFGLPGESGELSANLFGTDVAKRVEYEQIGRFQTAVNLGRELVIGGELEIRLRPLKPLGLRISSGVARTVAKEGGSAIPLGVPQVQNSMFPVVQGHFIVDWRLPWNSHLATEASYIGPRTSSQSNALIQGEPYQLPAYIFVGLSLSTTHRTLFGDRETSLSVRVNNVLDRRWSEPGFGGIEVPSAGVNASLTFVQQL